MALWYLVYALSFLFLRASIYINSGLYSLYIYIVKSWLRITLGKDTSTEMAPMKLQKEEMRPVTKSARSTGSTDKEHLDKPIYYCYSKFNC